MIRRFLLLPLEINFKVMRMKKIFYLIVIFVSLLSSVTISANLLPNVEIVNVDPKTLIERCIADMTKLGFTQTSADNHQITFKLDNNKNPLTTALAGYTDWFLQVSFLTLQKEKTVKITVSAQKIGITKSGASETVSDDSILWPTYLQSLKIKYNGGIGYGLVLAANPVGKVIAVSKGSDAEAQGIQPGCNIVQIDSHIVGFMSPANLEKYLIQAQPGTLLKMKIRSTDNQLKDYTLTNQIIPPETQNNWS